MTGGRRRTMNDELPARPIVARKAAVETGDLYEVVIECDSEDQQRKLYDEFEERGYRCRLLVI